jgi:signal transduction histidine kinase
VRRHHGTIDVSDGVAGGAVFTVRLRTGRLLETRS